MGRSIYQRIEEPTRYCKACSTSLVEHAQKTKYNTCFEDSKVVARVDHFHHGKLREAIEIEKRTNTLNRDDGWNINSS